MENHNNDKSESGRLNQWEKPVVKAEYDIADLTKMAGGLMGFGDGFYS